jgi:hypothetical protein
MYFTSARRPSQSDAYAPKPKPSPVAFAPSRTAASPPPPPRRFTSALAAVRRPTVVSNGALPRCFAFASLRNQMTSKRRGPKWGPDGVRQREAIGRLGGVEQLSIQMVLGGGGGPSLLQAQETGG